MSDCNCADQVLIQMIIRDLADLRRDVNRIRARQISASRVLADLSPHETAAKLDPERTG